MVDVDVLFSAEFDSALAVLLQASASSSEAMNVHLLKNMLGVRYRHHDDSDQNIPALNAF